MKKTIILALVASVVGVVSLADAQVQLNPAVMRAFSTNVHGTITVPAAAASGNLAGFKCSDLIMTATSKDYNPAPPGMFASPKWTRSAPATGNWASGQCSYSIIVPHSQLFALSASGSGPYDCGVISVGLSATPQWQSVGRGISKVDNVTVSSLQCIPPPP